MVELRLEFKSYDEAIVALGKLVGTSVKGAISPAAERQTPVAAPASPAINKERKGRSDKGQARKKGEAGLQSPGSTVSAGAENSPTTAAAASPTKAATAPDVVVSAAGPVSGAATQDAGGTLPSPEDVQKSLEAAFNVKGTVYMMELLARYGVKRGRDLLPEQRAGFIKEADDAVAAEAQATKKVAA